MICEISHESKRGCGYRHAAKGGVGIYLEGPPFNAACDWLPFELKVCRACGCGVKPSRGWTWITPRELIGDLPGVPEGRHGLIWIGEGHYPTPEDFLAEAQRMGISRKILALPKGFEPGVTRVYLAHRKAIRRGVVSSDGITQTIEDDVAPGIFASFVPTAVALVVDDENAIPEKATKLAEKLGDHGRIIKVVPADAPKAPTSDLRVIPDDSLKLAM